jgi:lysozyme
MTPGFNAVVDLSHHNEEALGRPLDFDAASRGGVVGVIYKATQGTAMQDQTYAANKAAAKSAGLLWGAYHFGSLGDGAAQADFFLATVGPDDNMLLALDLEDYVLKKGSPPHIMPLAEAERFVERVHALTGRRPGVYTRRNLADETLSIAAGSPLAQCWLWLSAYTATPRLPRAWADWTLWQYTGDDKGPNQPHGADGLGVCDRDTFNGDQASLRQFWTAS